MLFLTFAAMMCLQKGRKERPSLLVEIIVPVVHKGRTGGADVPHKTKLGASRHSINLGYDMRIYGGMEGPGGSASAFSRRGLHQPQECG